MASAQQLIGLVKSHAEGDADRFFDFTDFLPQREKLSKHLNTSIKFKSRSNNNGSIIINFSSKEELEAILNKMV